MDSIPSATFPRKDGSPVLELPINNEGPADFFPPVCLQSHWDPTAILRRTLPAGYVPQSTDPRPWTRICMEYTTAGEQDEAPEVDPSIVMPNGGAFYPASKYKEAIDNESKLRTLDRPLGTCEGNQWEPNPNGDMFNARTLVPDRKGGSPSGMIQELAYPRALLRSGAYDCRAKDDVYATQTTSDYMFNNATKQDRYKSMNKPTKPAAPAAPLKAAPETLRPDLLLNAGPPRPIPNAPPAIVSGSGSPRTMAVKGSDGSTYSVNPDDLTSMLTKNAQTTAQKSGVSWGAAQDPNPTRSYANAAANQAADLKANAVMVTKPFSDNSPFAPF